MKLENKINLIFLFLLFLIYSLITVLCINHGYFWDNIQQTSKEAHWFYLTNFHKLLMPVLSTQNGIVATGYHPPLIGIMTAALWKVFGYKIWVSHVFIFIWALVLIFNSWKIIRSLFPNKFAGFILLIVMLEPTLLAQFAIASPDFILFTAFIISLRAVLEKRPWMLIIGLFFLCCINMRGIFVGVILFLVDYYFSNLHIEKRFTLRSILKTFLPYLPTLLILTAYFCYYFYNRGWFFTGSSETGHYSLPNGMGRVIRHFAEYGLRSVENGRILIWIIGIYVGFKFFKSRLLLNHIERSLLLFFLLLSGLYIVFIFITQMPFSARYFMPQFFLLTILTLLGIIKFVEQRKIIFVFILILCFELTGHLWIYPDIIAKSWDCTLAHLPYYDLREKCFNYIDEQKLDYHQISSGFCLYGNRGFVELKNDGKSIGTDEQSKYFIFSNISNVEDSFADELKNKNHWIPVKRFEKGLVYITIFKNTQYNKK